MADTSSPSRMCSKARPASSSQSPNHSARPALASRQLNRLQQRTKADETVAWEEPRRRDALLTNASGVIIATLTIASRSSQKLFRYPRPTSSCRIVYCRCEDRRCSRQSFATVSESGWESQCSHQKMVAKRSMLNIQISVCFCVRIFIRFPLN